MPNRLPTMLLVAALGSGLAAAAVSPAAAGAPAAQGQATVYLIQGVDDTTMTLTLDGKEVAPRAAAKTIVGPLRLPAGRHTISASPGSGGQSVRATLNLKGGTSTDAVLHRQADTSKPPVITAYPNDLSAVTPGSSRLTVAHTAAVGPADIRVKEKVLFANVANGEQLSLTVPAGTYPVDIVPTGATGPVVFGPVDLAVGRSTLTRVFAIGVAATGSMDAVVQVLRVPTRGTGTTPARVDAGDGGQAQSLIRSHESAPGASPALFLALAGALLGAGLVLRVRRLQRRPA